MAVTAAKALLGTAQGAALAFKGIRYLIPAGLLLALWWLLAPYLRPLLGRVPRDAALQIGGGDVLADFYARRKAMAERLHSALRSSALTSSGRCEALYDALQWNDNQLRLLHNTYKNAYGKTIGADLQGTYTDDCSILGWTGGGLNAQLQSKLDALGLI